MLTDIRRDRALYSSPWFAKIDTRLGVPLNAIYSTLLFTVILSTVTIGNSHPLYTMMGLAVAALMTCYSISIASLMLKRLSGEALPRASWSLGKAGIWINGAALLYSVWSLFWSFWPIKYQPGATDFNWTLVLYFFVLGYASAFLIARRRRLGKHLKEMKSDLTLRMD